MRWSGPGFEFRFPRPALVMGVVNVTPDSFSDGGRHLDPARAADHAHQLVAEGADLVDIGGESTRPGAATVDADEECRRILPVIRRLAGRIGVPISVDTRKTVVAREALASGASVVNDIGAGRSDPGLAALLTSTGAGYVAMHMQGDPSTMQAAPAYADVVEEVRGFLAGQLRLLESRGVDPDRVVLDPGIGFGKTVGHNLDLLRAVGELTGLGRPVLIGVSRKSFLGRVVGAEVPDRLAAGLACTLWAARSGASVFRTHDVAATVQALRMQEALQG